MTILKKGYHDLVRPEILNLIPHSVTSCLDLGCGTGALGAQLKKRQSCFVVGVELNKEAFSQASVNLDLAFEDNLNRFDPVFLERKFDCIVFADILEHLVYPWSVLKKYSDLLSENGLVVASIPNFAHPWVLNQLGKGLLRYEPAGVLDFTHLRFFTKTTIFQLFYRAGLKIFNIVPFPSADNPIQFLVQAIKPALFFPDPLVTILMLSFNGWQMTEQTINSLIDNTEFPYKLLVIDNGSTDLTVTNLRKDPTLFHIENSCNLGFATGFNIGMELVDTPLFVLANNDVLFTPGWLDSLVKCAQNDTKVLAVGPVSNCVSGIQKVFNAKYTNTEEMHSFAKKRLDLISERFSYTDRLAFFLTLFKTEALQKIGFLDEIFPVGNFEDDDYCLRIRKAGYKMFISNTTFIHHHGSQTFRLNNINHSKTMDFNRKIFLKKHSAYLNSLASKIRNQGV